MLVLNSFFVALLHYLHCLEGAALLDRMEEDQPRLRQYDSWCRYDILIFHFPRYLILAKASFSV
jgi:hypothetical protein